MGGLLEGLPVGQIGIGGLLTIVILLILTGRLVPRQQMLDCQAREARAMELAERWQKVATEHGMTLSRILDYVETTNYAMNEIQSAGRRPHHEADSP